ncbi:hypothetical protein MHO82_09945 [Vibrio sp. Of7-15]|uniref:DUF6701 domain-containing protein n=1 Tax=Vibrio sp. Of7-15 TaxID=2724879 RepID=UPI001EF2668A|nr:DUF6701 domain-containing protein [Vibrio sp. Of7-15]MCG7497189.1 hypothetical protein [Vibrio sp. Of7-15]
MKTINSKPYWGLITLLLFICVDNTAIAMEFEFGRLRVDDCIQTADTDRCTITFSKSYAQPPLVFLMPTITKNGEDQPSSLRLMSVTNTQAQFRQIVAPARKAKAGIPFKPTPMTDIDYLVAEPGILKLSSGAQLLVGSFTTTQTIRNDKSTKPAQIVGGYETIMFNTFGLPSFDPWHGDTNLPPGVMTQIQSINNRYSTNEPNGHYAANQPQWMTSVSKDVTFSSFKFAIELSETRDANITQAETVGFVAGLGTGFVTGKKFWWGSGETKDTLGDGEEVYRPVEEECEAYTPIPASFSAPPILVAAKNSRHGSNGGWLRRCFMKPDEVSFVIEEDMDSDKERKHHWEKVGFFFFEAQKIRPVCEIFPSPAQTWETNTNGELLIDNLSKINGASTIAGQRFVGFSANKVNDVASAGCNGSVCQGDTGLMVPKANLEDFQAPTDPALYYINLVSNQTFQNDEHIGALTINNNVTATFKAGVYWIDSLNLIGGTINIPNNEQVTIHTKGLSLSQSAQINSNLSSELVVIVHDLPFSFQNSIHNRVDLANGAKFTGLLYSEKDVDLSNASTIEGAVTAANLRLHGAGNQIIGGGNCFGIPQNTELKLSPTTSSGLSCTGVDFNLSVVEKGTTQEADFTGSIDISLNNDSNIDACFVLEGNSPPTNCGEEDSHRQLTVAYPTSRRFSIFSKQAGEVYINAQVQNTSEMDLANVGPYSFLANGFLLDSGNDVDSINGGQIAVRPYSLTIQAVSSNNNSLQCQPLENYTNNQVPLLFSRSSPAGETPLGNYTLSDSTQRHTIETNTPVSLTFKSGVAVISNTNLGTPLTGVYSEAQQISLSVTGPSSCTSSGCNNATMSSNTLPLYHRPFALSVCSPNNHTLPISYGTSNSGDKLAIAGQGADVYIKAVPWVSQYANNDGSIKQPSIANGTATPNYVSYAKALCSKSGLKAFDGTFSLNASLHSPSNATWDNSNFSHLTLPQLANAQGYTSTITWNDVGSLALSPYKENYLVSGLNIPATQFVMGRFVPSHLAITSSQWSYPTGQNDFAYMDQPFPHSFVVEAQNSSNTATQNYGLFGDNFKTHISLMSIESQKASGTNDLSSRIKDAKQYSWGGAEWNSTKNTSQMSKTLSDFTFLRKETSASPRTTEPDGPYTSENTQFGLYASHVVDEVNFQLSPSDPLRPTITIRHDDSGLNTNQGQAYLTQPNVRYGRMTLTSVGGTQDQLSTPLSIEHWTGSQFEINTQDSVSYLDTVYQCQELIWPNSLPANSAPQLSYMASDGSTGGQASLGENHLVQAKHDIEGLRAQMRMWLLINSENTAKECANRPSSSNNEHQPWLLFNWRGEGDEDPSMVATFGIYRGNDRVIYRGEPKIGSLR